MIQKLFYGKQSQMIANKAVPDVVGREGLALVPAVVLMLLLGVASPYWIKAIGGAVSGLADNVAHATVTLMTNVAEKR
jgi:NADH-quinone oxidoreductase subunit M